MQQSVEVSNWFLREITSPGRLYHIHSSSVYLFDMHLLYTSRFGTMCKGHRLLIFNSNFISLQSFSKQLSPIGIPELQNQLRKIVETTLDRSISVNDRHVWSDINSQCDYESIILKAFYSTFTFHNVFFLFIFNLCHQSSKSGTTDEWIPLS